MAEPRASPVCGCRARSGSNASGAQDLSYIANQELLGGVPSAREFQAEFWQARTLPNKATAVKEQLEPDAVDGLLLGGAMRQAEELAARADRAQGAILDRLVPAEIASGRTQQAWSLWTALAPACGERAFVAARALLGTPSTPAQAASLLQEVLAAAGTIGSIAQAESAADFMESALAKYPAKKRAIGTAALSAAARLDATRGPGWEVREMRARLRTIVSAAAPQDLDQFQRSLRPAPLQPSRRPAPRGAPLERPPGSTPKRPTRDVQLRMDEFAAEAWYALHRDPIYSAWNEDQAGKALKKLTPTLAAALPVATARLAAACFEFGWLRRERRVLATALDTATLRANAYKFGDQIALSNSPVLTVFGLAAEIDFPETATRALALRSGPMKPLILAHVARMAQAATRWKPGHAITALH